MRDLESALEYSFENCNYGYSWKYNSPINRREESLYMIIPTTEDTLEIPTFTLGIFEKNYSLRYGSDALVVTLKHIGKSSNYKTLDTSLKDSLTGTYTNDFLVKLPDAKDSTRKYYVTNGAIFDEDFKPIMMLTWEVKKALTDKETACYDFLRPILRVRPEVFINKSNSIERYVINKIVPTALSLNYISAPFAHGYDLFKVNGITSRRFKAKVIIDKIPFEIKATDVPSISTTNEELLNIALNNIDELVE